MKSFRPAWLSLVLGTALVAAFAGACSSNAPPQTQPMGAVIGSYEPPLRPLPPLDAQVRMVGSETTWVARGPGYELVARSRPDMPTLKAALDVQARNYHEAFGADPHNVVVTVRRVSPDPRFNIGPAPFPQTQDPVVEIAVGDTGFKPLQPTNTGPMRDTPTRMGGTPLFGERRVESLGPVSRVLAAWLGSRSVGVGASTSSFPPATSDTSRAPAWAIEAVGALGSDSLLVTLWAVQLATASDSLLPIDRLLTASPPPARDRATQGEGRDARAGNGRPNSERGRGGPGDQGYRLPPLRGAMLFMLEARVFGQYLASRDNARLIGRVVDAQLQGKPVVSAFSGLTTLPDNLTALETHWRHWLDVRARYTRNGGR